MHGPPLVGWLLVALSAASGGYCLLIACRPATRRTGHGADALMGFGMALMAVPELPSPDAWLPSGFAVLFTAAGLTALLRGLRPRHRAERWHHLQHAVAATAMVYMAVAMRAAGHVGHTSAGHIGHSAGMSGIPLVTGLLLAYFTVQVIMGGLRLGPAVVGTPGSNPSTVPAVRAGAPAADADPAAPPRTPAWTGWPEVNRACRLAMDIGMLGMLLLM